MQRLLLLLFVSMPFFFSTSSLAIERAQDLAHEKPRPTLDRFISPQEMIQELGLSLQITTPENGPAPLTPEEVQQMYGVDVFAEFPVVIVIDTAVESPTAQTVEVFHQSKSVAVYKTSTGREQWEEAPSGKRYFSDTPVGWFRPQFFIEDHHSSIWDAPMKLSIFFNGGIAVHATTPDLYGLLGSRASGGCVRLTEEDAQALWDLTVDLPEKEVPVFDVQGALMTDANQQVIRRMGSAVLFLVVNSDLR